MENSIGKGGISAILGVKLVSQQLNSYTAPYTNAGVRKTLKNAKPLFPEENQTG